MRYLLLLTALVPSFVGQNNDQPFGVSPIAISKVRAEEKCLATMIYGEARGEKKTGQIAVAYSAMNRATTKKSLCDVVLTPKQYSIFNNNPALRAAATSMHITPNMKNGTDEDSWEQALYVAKLVSNRTVPDPTNGSTHYLAPRLMALKKYRYPTWLKKYVHVVTINNHKFYKPVDKNKSKA